MPLLPALLVALLSASCGKKTGSSTLAVSSSTAAAVGSSSTAAAVAPPPAPLAGGCSAPPSRRLERASVPGGSSSPVELVRSGAREVVLVADADESAVHALDASSMREIAVTPLPGRPAHLLALGDGRVAVSLRDSARVALLEADDDRLERPMIARCSIAVPSEPIALAEAAGGALLVAGGSSGTLSRLRASDRAVTSTVKVAREPRAIAVTEGGSRAFVAHAAGGSLSVVSIDHEALSPAEGVSVRAGLREGSREKNKDKPEPREASQGFSLATLSGERAGGGRGEIRLFAPHLSVDPGAPDVPQSTGYGSGSGDADRPVAPVVAVIDPVKRASITDDPMLASTGSGSGCLLPRAALADGSSLFVACMDMDAVLELDPFVADPSVAEKRRFAVVSGPTGLALGSSRKHLFVFGELDRAVARVDLGSGQAQAASLWRRAGTERDAKIERGRRLFHTSRDARIALGRACAGCHPDGRDDGLVWTSPEGRRQTPSLAGRLDRTAPYGWRGESPTVKEHLKRTFERLRGVGFDERSGAADLDALVAYVQAIPPPPPPSASGPESGEAKRGREVFVAAGCEGCHPAGGTDGLTHDVGSGSPGSSRPAFDTPSLRGIGASAPYFHDGRYDSLEALLTAPDDRMIASPIAEPDRQALLAYLETL